MITFSSQTPLPGNDGQRVQALKRYQILGSAPEESFDNIARLATQIFNLPMALINFVDTDNVFLKVRMGAASMETSPRNTSLCSLAIQRDEVTVFETIPHFEPCVLVDSVTAGEIGLKFYAGAPLITPDNFRIGTICVMGMEKRTFSRSECEMLSSLAKVVMDVIELRLTANAG